MTPTRTTSRRESAWRMPGVELSFARATDFPTVSLPATFPSGPPEPARPHPYRRPEPGSPRPAQDFITIPGEVPRHQSNRLDAALVAPYIHQYTLQIEQELAFNLRIRASYVGSRNWKLFRHHSRKPGGTARRRRSDNSDDQRSAADPQFFSIARTTNRDGAYFDAGRCRWTKLSARGLALRATYTFSKALGTSTDFSNTGIARDEQRAQKESIALEDLKRGADSTLHIASCWDIHTCSAMDGWVHAIGYDDPAGWDSVFRPKIRIPLPFGNVDGERNDRPVDSQPGTARNQRRPSRHGARGPARDAFDASASFRDGRGNLSRTPSARTAQRTSISPCPDPFPYPRTRHEHLVPHGIDQRVQPSAVRPSNDRSGRSELRPDPNTQNAGRIIQVHLRFSF